MPWPLAANVSMLFTDAPLIERVHRAGQAGFDGVEVQFPYDTPASALSQALQSSNLPLVLINVPAGDLMSGGPGLAGVPERQAQFEAALEQALDYARQLRPQRVNVLPGKLPMGASREHALATLAANCRKAATRFAEEGIGVTCEAINRHDMPDFLVATPDELRALLDHVDHPNFQAQLDVYHMARMGDGTGGAVRAMELLAGRIGHVQFADCPGRGAPGEGSLDFAAIFCALQAADYTGWIAAEYRSATDELQWMTAWCQEGWVR